MKTNKVKNFWELGIGDMVTSNGDVWVINKVTKTQYTAQKLGSDGSSKYHFIRITISRQSVVGEHNYVRVLEGTPEDFYAAIEAKRAEKQAEKDARAQEWERKVNMVREANNNITISDEGMGLSKAIMVNSKGEKMMVYFSQEAEDFWQDYSQPPVKGVRISCSTWCKRWSDRYGFSQTDARGLTVEEALIDLVAGHYWD